MGQIFDGQLRELGLVLDDIQKARFEKYYEMLIQWNKVMNLTGITDYDEVNLKHFVDSLSIVRSLDLTEVSTLIDVGTGAGFPGIPIKIVFPHIRVMLLDSLNKRISFLKSVIGELELENISAIHGRAEDYARNTDYREKYDVCVSRAVANLSTLSEYCIPFVHVGGNFVSYKGIDCEQEIINSENAVDILGGRVDNVDKFCLPSTDIGRALINVRKIRKTPGKYPRKTGLPSKEPLV